MEIKTQNDLSWNKAELDLQALHRTAQIAYWKSLYALREETEAELRRWDNKDYQGRGPSQVYLDGIKKSAIDLAIVGDVYRTLQGALKREKVEIVNHQCTKEQAEI